MLADADTDFLKPNRCNVCNVRLRSNFPKVNITPLVTSIRYIRSRNVISSRRFIVESLYQFELSGNLRDILPGSRINYSLASAQN